MVTHPNVMRYPYHAIIYLPNAFPHLIGMQFQQAMKRIALPLRGEVIAVELQTAYDNAYQEITTAAQMLNNSFYTEANLPFPSLLTEAQIHNALKTVDRWREELKRLETNKE
jgi:hypothetical protein